MHPIDQAILNGTLTRALLDEHASKPLPPQGGETTCATTGSAHAARLTIGCEVDGADVPPGSVVDDGESVTVRMLSGNGWHCAGDNELPGPGWSWSNGPDRCRILATGLTGDECREVVMLDPDAARAWCAARAKKAGA